MFSDCIYTNSKQAQPIYAVRSQGDNDLGGRAGDKGASRGLLGAWRYCFLGWGLVTQVCSIGDNSSSGYTYGLYFPECGSTSINHCRKQTRSCTHHPVSPPPSLSNRTVSAPGSPSFPMQWAFISSRGLALPLWFLSPACYACHPTHVPGSSTEVPREKAGCGREEGQGWGTWLPSGARAGEETFLQHPTPSPDFRGSFAG